VTSVPGRAGPPEAAELLERAIVYTRGALASVRPQHLLLPSPCPGWPLIRLLHHMDDSLAAMGEVASSAHLTLAPTPSMDTAEELLSRIRQRACALVGPWATSPRSLVELGGWALERETMGRVGALEITLHGWDVGQVCGAARPVPPVLAMDLWPVARDHIADADRPCRVGPALELPEWATPQERLLGHTGRRA
jgi:uncharacterized protein (TIGR03086 family)